jgi:Uma2 family endonuclease
MSISLSSTDPADLQAEPSGHDYRLSDNQFRRTIEARIIPEADRVELLDGFLVQDGSHYPLSLDQYRAMAEAHILTTDDRIELLEGWLVAKMTKYPRHTISKNSTRDAFMALVPAGWYVTTEDPLDAVDSEPEPDVSIIRGTTRDYMNHYPGMADTALVVEVADTSLTRDRSRKKRIYARAGFSIYWIINLIDNQIEVYTNPAGAVAQPDYRNRQDFGPDDMIPLVIEGLEIGRIAVRELLP